MQITLLALVCFLFGLLLTPYEPFVRASENKVKAPTWLYGFNVRSRKAGEYNLNKDTKKIGIEFYSNEKNGSIIYVSE